jgi:LacI family transcriptional regulator
MHGVDARLPIRGRVAPRLVPMTSGESDPAPRLPSPRVRRPTILDVAAAAGVSKSTVSRVLSGEFVADEDMIRRVMEAAGGLGYRTDHRARSLRRADGYTSNIGLVFDDVANPFFAAVHRGIEEVARERGVLPLVGSTDRFGEREVALVDSFSSRGIDGFVIAPVAGSQAYLERERLAGAQFVFVDRPPRGIAGDHIVIDNAGAIIDVVGRLVRGGHRRIAFLGGRDPYSATQRLMGFQAGMARSGVDVDERLVEIGLEQEMSRVAMAKMLTIDAPPTAVISAQVLVTQGVLTTLHERGLRHRIAQVGFDDFPLAELLTPGLSTVAANPVGIGRLAAQLLFERIDGNASAPRSFLLPADYVARGSGETPLPSPF